MKLRSIEGPISRSLLAGVMLSIALGIVGCGSTSPTATVNAGDGTVKSMNNGMNETQRANIAARKQKQDQLTNQ